MEQSGKWNCFKGAKNESEIRTRNNLEWSWKRNFVMIKFWNKVEYETMKFSDNPLDIKNYMNIQLNPQSVITLVSQ